MRWTRFARACAATVTLAVALGACGGGSDAPPRDPWEHLMSACTNYAEVACAKNAECLPPADPNCMSTQLASCIDDGQQGGVACVPTAASAIDSCTPKLEAESCTDYCSTSGGVTVCLSPCLWFC